ncbi:MAG: hypothetical protein K0R48_28 [Gammaproteobacteria bacterium]|jgi:hypothetical protein|nr:hypothetical protein [Gammaproteobacteria bacterium]
MGENKLKLRIPLALNERNVLNELNNTSYPIVDFLPQNSLALVRNSKMAVEILNMVYHIIKLLLDCLNKFYVSEQYQYFDPHVGDTACQTRAYIFFLLSKSGYSNNTASDRIHSLNTALNKLTEILRAPITHKNRRQTIVELLKKHGCYFSVEWQECFLYYSYFLTLFKKSNAQGLYICNDEIAHFFGISKTLSKKMIYKYQLHLAMTSCEFIKVIALDLNINEENCPSIVSAISYDAGGRMVYPCFFSSKILFTHMQKTRCTVLIILETLNETHHRKDLILFDKGDNHGSLLTEKNSPLKEETGIVVICTRIAAIPLSPLELLRRLNHFGLYVMLLMNAATHPQFTGSKLAPFAEEFIPDTANLVVGEREMKEEFLTLKSKAQKYGFCLDNPSILLIKHIFMDTIKNQINLYQNNYNHISVREIIDI